MKLLHLKVVLAAVDDDERADNVLRGARALATSAGAELHVLHVNAERAPSSGKDGENTKTAQMMQRLMDDAGIPAGAVTTHILNGEPAGAIRSIADQVSADVIALGRHRGGTANDAIGSTALRVVTNSWAPCLILSKPLRLPLTCVLAPVDLSDTSRGALVVALSWASALRGAKGGVALTALVVESARVTRSGRPAPKQMLDEALNRLRKDAGTWANVDVSGAIVTRGDVVTAIAESVSEMNADLVVLGTRGLGLDAVGRLGSISLGVAQKTHAPILLVPPAVWRSYWPTS
jgi:nucleotide-binding universal stress UspA family protein